MVPQIIVGRRANSSLLLTCWASRGLTKARDYQGSRLVSKQRETTRGMLNCAAEGGPGKPEGGTSHRRIRFELPGFRAGHERRPSGSNRWSCIQSASQMGLLAKTQKEPLGF